MLVFSEKEDLEVDPLTKRGGNEEADVESVVVGHQLDSGGRLYGQSHGTRAEPHWHLTKFNKGIA